MSLNATIAVEDTATPWVARLNRNLTPHRMAAAIGPGATKLVQNNFRKLGTNAKGWPTTHFYGRAAEATNWQEGAGFVEITVNQIGIRQRLMGGPIRPVNKKWLTIPAQPDAYGKTAPEFSDLVFKMVLDPDSGRVRPALVEKAGIATTKTTRKRKRKANGQFGESTETTTVVSMTTGLVALFWLAKGVNQEADAKVMPSDQEFDAVFDASVKALTQ